MKLSGLLLPKGFAQSSLSLEHYYTMGVSGPASMPIASFQGGEGFYAEGRYNYEALNTFSFYMGRTFSKESKLSYSISPIAGVVIGDLNGGSVGANVSLGYKNFFLYSQPQYTFSVQGAYDNYIYSWTDLTYSPLDWLSVGISLQHTKGYKTEGFIENGLVIEAAYKKVTFPLYIFSPGSKDRSFVLGASFDMNFKKRKSSPPKNDDPFTSVYPAKMIADAAVNSPIAPAKASAPADKQPVPPTESVIKVRRVNVDVQTKSESIAKADKGKGVKQTIVSDTPKMPVAAKVFREETPQQTTPSSHIERKTDVPKAADRDPVKNKGVAAQVTAPAVHFALLLGPFRDEVEAVSTKEKLNEGSNREIIVFVDKTEYKLRIPGFFDKESAQLFGATISKEGCLAASSIIQYSIKKIDAIPLKVIAKPFEASKL